MYVEERVCIGATVSNVPSSGEQTCNHPWRLILISINRSDLNSLVMTGSSRVFDHTTFSELQGRRDLFFLLKFLYPTTWIPSPIACTRWRVCWDTERHLRTSVGRPKADKSLVLYSHIGLKQVYIGAKHEVGAKAYLLDRRVSAPITLRAAMLTYHDISATNNLGQEDSAVVSQSSFRRIPRGKVPAYVVYSVWYSSLVSSKKPFMYIYFICWWVHCSLCLIGWLFHPRKCTSCSGLLSFDCREIRQPDDGFVLTWQKTTQELKKTVTSQPGGSP